MTGSHITTAPLRAIAYAPAEVACHKTADGGFRLRAARDLDPFDESAARLFRRACASHPDRLFVAERNAAGAWDGLTYAEARAKVDALAQALLDRGLSADRPVMILSGNSVEHALLMLAGFTAGIPVAPISVAYSLQSQDHAKLKYINALLTPGLVYVADTGPFAKALAHVKAPVVAGLNSAELADVTPFAQLAETRPGADLDRAVAATNGDTIAKFLFTSGSTGIPKGVVNTHRMLTANQQSLAQIWPFVSEQPLVLVDWLPWNHTFGGNHNLNLVLRHAGTLYIDEGKPLPGLVEKTVRNIAEISPTIYFNVPAGFGALLPFLEKDEAIARSFFAKLRLIFYAGAALPQDLWERLDAVAVRTTGERIPMTSSWGTTETAPAATASHFLIERAGVIGVPIPGVELKLAPSDSKLEIRVRGPNVTSGYWRSPDHTAAAFDDEGFYCSGDAVKFADPGDPAKGLVFDGRIAEDFKLTNGTWVHVGTLRVGALAAASPVLQDAIVVGEGCDYIGLVAWLSLPGCRQVVGDGAPGDLRAMATHPEVHRHVRQAFARWNAQAGGITLKVARVLLLPDAPSIDANEITDKGYINQRLAREHRKSDVARLFAASSAPDLVIVAG